MISMELLVYVCFLTFALLWIHETSVIASLVMGIEKDVIIWVSNFFSISFFRSSRFVRRKADIRMGLLIRCLRASSFVFASGSDKRSILLSVTMMGMPDAPMRSIVSRQIVYFFSIVSSGSFMSRTRIMTSV